MHDLEDIGSQRDNHDKAAPLETMAQQRVSWAGNAVLEKSFLALTAANICAGRLRRLCGSSLCIVL